uniref:hypothetical protein n=1 Tax=Bradyrhizobium sp. SZCCHNR3027 TaxID=3057402 RepID=UPI0028ED545B
KSNVTYLSNAAETAFRDRNYYSAQLASISRELADAKSNVTYLSNAAETAFRDRNYYSAQLASARKAAIEECVKIAERFAGANAVSEPYTSYIQGRAEGAQAVAAHIRAAALTDKEGTSRPTETRVRCHLATFRLLLLVSAS